MASWQTAWIWMTAVSLMNPPVSDREIVCQGLVTLIESVDVPAAREGRIEAIKVKEGNYVSRGQILGHLDNAEAKLVLKRSELENQLALEKSQSEISLNSARLIQEVTRNEFQRAVQVRQSSPSSISITEFDRLKLESEKSANEVTRLLEEKRFAVITSKSKEAELHLAQLAFEERQVFSPLDGIVVQLHRHEGEWVRIGERVLRIVRIDRLRVECFVDLQSSLASLEGASAVLEVSFPDSQDQAFSGEVVFVHPEADPVNGQIRIWAEIENRGRMLRPGQKGRLKVHPQKKLVPSHQPAVPPANDVKSR